MHTHSTLSQASMRLTFLGTGTSMGIPMLACSCAVCNSGDPYNQRLRTSALLECADLKLLFDAGPDLRQQALRVGLKQLDAVLLTHTHADHISGIDDLRPLNFAQKASIPLYGTADMLDDVRQRFAYAFSEEKSESTRPALELVSITHQQPFQIGALTFLPVAVQHGSWTITGFRCGRLGYVTDASALCDATRAALQGLDVLVLNALRTQPHPTHFSIDQALEAIAELQPKRAFLIHMGHEVDHVTTNARLPAHVRLAYDGLAVNVEC